MKTSGIETVLSALTGDSASVNGGNSPVGDIGAFNAAFDAAARSAEKNGNVESDSNPSPLHGSSAIHDSEQGGNALPNNGKGLPNTEGTSTAESVIAEGLAENSAPTNALAPSPFMKAALDNAAAVIKPEAPAGTPSQLSTSVKSPPMTGAVSVAPKVFDQALMRKEDLGASSDSAAQRSFGAKVDSRASSLLTANTQILEGQFSQPGGSTAGDGAVNKSLNAAGFSTTVVADSAKAFQREALDVALDSSQARTNGLREGIAVNAEVAPRAAEAPVTSLAGLNPTTRLAELTAANAATQVADFKASPNAADFPQEVLARVRMIQGQGSTEARLNLHPAELGRLQIAITSDGDATRVAFVVDNAQAKETLEQAMPRLREFLQQAGLQLAEGSVSQQGQQGSAGFAQNEARSGEARSGSSEGSDDEGVITKTSEQLSDPNRIFDAYA